jgi:hypothetical protein
MASSTCDARRSVLTAALVLLVAARPASAAPGPAASVPGGPGADAVLAKSAAQAKLVEGVGLLKDRRYGEALQRFKEAHALVPSPLIDYDFGLAYVGLGESARALESFDTFLGEARDAPADKRRNAERYRGELRGRVAVVELDADVGAAELSVDGLSLGRVSFPRRLYLEPGWHEIVARIEIGGAAHAATVTGEGGQTLSVTVRLIDPPQSPAAAVAAGATAGSVTLPQPPAPPVMVELHGPNAIEAMPAPPPRTSASRAGVWALSGAALGVVSLGTGLVFGVMAKSEGDTLTDDARNRQDFRPSIEAAGMRDQRLEAVFLSIGAVALVASVGLYAILRHRSGGGSPPAEGTP